MKFILNDRTVTTDLPSGMVLVDFLREEKRLVGTKIGCREGDCGACTILVGELCAPRLRSGHNKERGLSEVEVRYRSITSCITPLGNMAGKHVVTVEGINMDDLSPVQQAMVDRSGAQCGFCTVGFVMSMTGYAMGKDDANTAACISAIDGNICRCTGYKPIERAADDIAKMLVNRPKDKTLNWLVEHRFLPDYFKDIAERLQAIQNDKLKPNWEAVKTRMIGGGTDLYVQRPDDFVELDVVHSDHQAQLKGITIEEGVCYIGASNVVTDLLESDLIRDMIPQLYDHVKLVSSTPIRNISTFAGNFVNASPIGDFTAFFIALNATVHIAGNEGSRFMLLKQLYKGYKDLEMTDDEIITKIEFPVPDASWKFNLEKVSKRIYLDIASVNTAIGIDVRVGLVWSVHISAGGVGPTPMELTNTCKFLIGKQLTRELVEEALKIVQEEISPISDVRGSAEYKRLLLNQLITAHFHKLFPEIMREEVPV